MSSIHVWWAELDQPEGIVEVCRGMLNRAEREGIERFHTETLRTRHTVAKGVLRSLIARYQNVAADAVRIGIGKHGKPRVDPDESGSRLEFNVSHARDIGMFAFSRGTCLGVDVEEMRPMSDLDGVMEMCLSGFERGWLEKMPDPDRLEGFYRVWTIKEAYLKAIGTGLSISPAEIEIRMVGESEFEFHRLHGRAVGSTHWTVVTFSRAPRRIGALVFEGGPRSIASIHWDPSVLNPRQPSFLPCV